MITQRLVNNYPAWTKIRKDPSSFGFRMNSVFGDHFDFVYGELKQNYLSWQLNKEGLGLGEIWFINLEPDDYMLSTATTGGSLSWTYPVVVADSRSLQRVESLEELYWSVPDRLVLHDQLDTHITVATKSYLAEPTIATMLIDSRLRLRIQNSTDWFKRTALNNRLQPGIHRVIIDGYDADGVAVAESIDVVDDGDYYTRTIYSGITNLTTQGFNGDITLTAYAPKTVLEDTFHLAVSDSGLEGPLYMELSYNDDSATSQITYYTSLVKQGENYKDGVDQLPYNREDLWTQALLDSDGNEIEVIDTTVNPNTTRLYALDTSGTVHVYEYGLQRFSPPSLESTLTKATYIDIDPAQYWGSYGETIMMFTRFSRPRFPVSRVEIKRISPTGVVNYLQADKSWSVSQYSWQGNPNAKGFYENTFQDITFETVCSEYGQWEFYCTCISVHDTTVTYTAICVDSMQAIRSLSTGLTDLVSINYSDDGYLAILKDRPTISDPYTVYKYKELSDVFLADEENQTLYFREEYNLVEVN